MTIEKFEEILNSIQIRKSESTNLEIKSANKGCPKKLFDTLSSFSNQDDGGVIVFGVDEEHDYEEAGVYDAQDLQKQVTGQCLQMCPTVRPLFTVLERNGKIFVAAEIPAVDLAERPCYYRGVGRIKGSYVRCVDSDEPMTEYEIYSYEAFRKKYQDDIRTVARATMQTIDKKALDDYIQLLKSGKPNMSELSDDTICELMSITRDKEPTLSAVLLFGLYPQAFFPGLCITAVSVPGTEIGEVGNQGERFIDNQKIEGNIVQMLDGSLQFVKKNLHNKTIIDPDTGKRADKTDYPMTAVREAVLNALVHRDYSIHTEAMPIRILIFEDRMEIHNPGGIYGRMRVDQLGKMQPNTRNPVLAAAMETLGITENRYSGIPTIRREMSEYGLPEPEFADSRGSFCVCFRKTDTDSEKDRGEQPIGTEENKVEIELLQFCRIPRTKKEISTFLGLKSVSYAVKKYVTPMVEQGKLYMSLPDKPKSSRQQYCTEQRVTCGEPHVPSGFRRNSPGQSSNCSRV